MKLRYSISLWNYIHYYQVPDLNEIAEILHRFDLGIELWNLWRGELDFSDSATRSMARNLFAGLPVSYHTEIGKNSREFHKKQIATAAEVNAQILVLHSDNLFYNNSKELDVELTGFVVEHANSCGVKVVLENGQLPFLSHAIEQVPSLEICLDIGHVYLTEEPMEAFLEALDGKIVHLHLQEILSNLERELLDQGDALFDHYIPGTGSIPEADWALLFAALKKNGYDGTAVFEIQPRNPLQTAVLGRDFVNKFL